MADYVFRLDDICPNMNWQNFCRIRDIFIERGIRPVLGVIPDNKDSFLVKQSSFHDVPENLFWQEIKKLQDDNKWVVALHGFNHLYVNNNSGILHINKRSEFAGLNHELQAKKIREGKAILESRGLKIKVFMAPSHSFDWETVEALKDNSIFNVTDGISAFPYMKKGIMFVPNVLSWPKRKRVGIYTVCFHVNEWNDDMFEKLEKVLDNEWLHAIDYPFEFHESNTKYKIVNIIVKMEYFLRRIASFVKHRIIIPAIAGKCKV